MRAVLVLAVLMMWAACILGAAGLTAYLTMVAVSLVRRRHGSVNHSASPPPRATVIFLVMFAVIMAAFAAFLSGVQLLQSLSNWHSALAWAALPSWAALAAGATAVVLSRRRRAQARGLHTFDGYPGSS